jgi:hypothetical protein
MIDPRVDIDALAQLAGLEIPAEYRDGVATQFLALMVQAELVLSVALGDDIEPAPVFTP